MQKTFSLKKIACFILKPVLQKIMVRYLDLFQNYARHVIAEILLKLVLHINQIMQNDIDF